MNITYLGNSKFNVDSKYNIDLKYGTDGICECKAFLKSGVFCKHIKEIRARLKDNWRGIENAAKKHLI